MDAIRDHLPTLSGAASVPMAALAAYVLLSLSTLGRAPPVASQAEKDRFPDYCRSRVARGRSVVRLVWSL